MTSLRFCPACGAARAEAATICAACRYPFSAAPAAPAEPTDAAGPAPGAHIASVAARPPRRRTRGRGYRILVGVFVVLAALVGIAAALNGGIAGLILPGGGGSGSVAVTYSLTGSAARASITYTNGAGNTEQQADVKVPMGAAGQANGLTITARHGAIVSFIAQNETNDGDLTCTISAAGVVLTTSQSRGGYTVVTCSTSVP